MCRHIVIFCLSHSFLLECPLEKYINKPHHCISRRVESVVKKSRLIVRNLRYLNSLRNFYLGEILTFYKFWGEKLGLIFIQCTFTFSGKIFLLLQDFIAGVGNLFGVESHEHHIFLNVIQWEPYNMFKTKKYKCIIYIIIYIYIIIKILAASQMRPSKEPHMAREP